MTDNSTQQHLKVASIEEGVLILKNGALAVVLKAQPINFDLKNELEQNAIVAKYQGFLNGLDYPIQIVIRSKKLDLEPYLDELENRTKNQMNELLQVQSTDYISFMRSLVDIANIMSKEYYVVISYHRSPGKTNSGLLSVFSKTSTPKITRSEFDRLRGELNNRANTVAGGLSQLGLKVDALDTQKLIELYYGLYNPDISSTERLVGVENIQAGVVTRAEEAPIQAAPQAAPAPRNDSITINPAGEDVATAVGAVQAPIIQPPVAPIAQPPTAPDTQPADQTPTEQTQAEQPPAEEAPTAEPSNQPAPE